MARLRRLPDRLGVLPGRIAAVAAAGPGRDAVRDRVQPWRAWYKTARWQRLRWSVLERDRFTCRICGRVEGQTSRLVADHVRPHRGDARLFWDDGNLQCLCKGCHDSTKQGAERSGG